MLLNGLLCLGFIVALLLLVGLLFIAVFSSRAENRERETLNTGRPMLATVVMANSDLYDPDGPESLPGVVVFAFFAPTPQLADALKTVAERCYECYEHPAPDQLAPPFRALALRMKDHRYRESRRTLVPPEVTNGLQVYVADVILYRDRFLDGWSEHRITACAISGLAEGQIAHLPLESPGSRQIHQSVGPEIAQLYARTIPADGVYAAGHVSSDAGNRTKARELRFYLVVGSVLLMTAAGCGGCLFTRMFSGGDDGGPVANNAVDRRTTDAPNGAPTDTRRTDPTRTDPTRTDPRRTPPRTTRSPISTRPSFTPPKFERPTSRLPKFEPPKVEPPRFEPPKFQPPVFQPPSPTPNVPSPEPGQPGSSPPIDPSPLMSPGDPRLLPSNMRSAGELTVSIESESDVVLGPASCPVAVVKGAVVDLKSGGRRAKLSDEPVRDCMKALSADGNWLAVTSEMPNQHNTTVAVYKTSTGERAMTVPGQPGRFVDLLAFTRDKFLLTGGRHASGIDIWDASTGAKRPTIQSPAQGIRAEQTSVSPDGQWYTAALPDSIMLVSTKANGPRIKLQPPSARPGERVRNQEVETMIRNRMMAAMAQTFRFSPDSQELAAVIDSSPLQFVCWNLGGKVLVDVDISEARERYFFRRSLAWFPDKSGWVIAGHFLDRAKGRIVTSIPATSISSPLLIQPLDRKRLLAVLPNEPRMLGIYEIEWPK